MAVYYMLFSRPHMHGVTGYAKAAYTGASFYPSECMWLVPGTDPDDPHGLAAEAVYANSTIIAQLEALPYG